MPRLLTLLEHKGISPSRLQFEVTESAMMDPNSNVAAKLVERRVAGIIIALDDFGTGYSRPSYIRDLSVDRKKNDRSFVATIDASNGSLVVAIVIVAPANGLAVGADGVATETQHAFLTAAGCEELQGFLRVRPLPASRVSRTQSNA